MSELDDVGQSVATSRERVNDARTIAAGSQRQLTDHSEEFNGLGLHGVYAELHAAAEHLQTTEGNLGEAAQVVESASSSLSDLNDQAQTSVILSALSGAIEKLRAAVNAVAAAEAEAEEAKNRSANAEVEPAIETSTRVILAVSDARQACDQAQTQASGYQVKLHTAAAKNAGLPAGDVAGRPAGREHPGWDGFTHRRPHPGAVESLRRHGWPKNDAGRTSARGHLYDSEGRRVDSTDVMRPHRKGHAPPCEDLREPWRSDPEYTTTWHAERDAAKIMRDNNMHEAVLYLNIPPCGRYSEGNRRCDVNLEKILPANSTL